MAYLHFGVPSLPWVVGSMVTPYARGGMGNSSQQGMFPCTRNSLPVGR